MCNQESLTKMFGGLFRSNETYLLLLNLCDEEMLIREIGLNLRQLEQYGSFDNIPYSLKKDLREFLANRLRDQMECWLKVLALEPANPYDPEFWMRHTHWVSKNGLIIYPTWKELSPSREAEFFTIYASIPKCSEGSEKAPDATFPTEWVAELGRAKDLDTARAFIDGYVQIKWQTGHVKS